MRRCAVVLNGALESAVWAHADKAGLTFSELCRAALMEYCEKRGILHATATA